MTHWQSPISAAAVVALACVLLSAAAPLGAQRPPLKEPSRELVRPAHVSSSIRTQLRALGDRLWAPGKESFVLSGTLTEGRNAARPVQLTVDRAGKLRLQQTGPNPRTLGFDGNAPWRGAGSLASADREVIESLMEDSPDRLIRAYALGYPVRVLGRRFRVDDGTTRDYKGPWFDIYEVGLPHSSRDPNQLQVKRFVFDSFTGLLQKVRYIDNSTGTNRLVETRYESWQLSDGQAYPGRISRVVDDKVQFVFEVQAAQVAGKVPDATFRGPAASRR